MSGTEAQAPRPIRVLLLCGGSSDEHQVSLASARSVLEAAAAAGGRLQVTPSVVTRDGRLVPPAESRRLLADPAGGATTPNGSPEELLAGALDVSSSLAGLSAEVDVVFPLLHGPNGEDGTVQGLLKLMGLPFVGSGVLGSAVAMDKLTMKSLFAAAGLPQVEYRGFTRHAYRNDPLGQRAEIAKLGFPVFVKPANLGSSIGIARVDAREELDGAIPEGLHGAIPEGLHGAIESALSFDRRVIVEAAAVGARELELAVLGNDDPQVSGVGEIVHGGEFYDYDTKYTDGRAELRIPADVPATVAQAAQELALAAFKTVDAAGLARVDLFYLPDGRLLVNELNTMPGFTEHSMYPKLWQAAGLAYPELVERLVRLALDER